MTVLCTSHWHSPANKEPFLNQLAHVILVHNWYRSTSTCFHVYSREYTCSACCHKFWTSLTQVVLGQNRYGFTDTCHHVKNSWFHSKHVLPHQICSQNPVNSRELSQLNSWIHLQNMWNHDLTKWWYFQISHLKPAGQPHTEIMSHGHSGKGCVSEVKYVG